MAHMSVRSARESDAAGIAAVHVQAWREAYAHLMPAAFLSSLDTERREAGWKSIIDDEITDVFVALDGEKVIGWASAGAGRDSSSPAARELEGIYVIAAAYGSGAGQQLLDAAVGDDAAYLWMAENNPRAEAFYRRNRFERDGMVKTESFGGASVHVVRLTR
ncbi:GNAT family N-acetyltransferase [Curtobacterium pusillum]|uniref:GNAT family N-acetyltransferase n=2 Tax=Curtobacterium pusillum TaxID=69373 RepID=A0ABX2MHB5_9MICO|nr:GNAT family N-acetyltransferase [Curtobacterium pusillum]NUU15116.1 GNAT family N-acetyltransferase [Curtobacterium pusillum]GLK31557.1 N-acetyltransferase [Curtobacterium pusillum]